MDSRRLLMADDMHQPHTHVRSDRSNERGLMMKPCLTVILVLGMLLATVGIVHAQVMVFSTVEGSIRPIAEEVMIEAYKRMGMTIEVRTLPPERAIQEANNGEVDGDLYRKRDIDKAYPNLIVVPVPIVSIDEMVFTKADKKFSVDGWESLLPYTVGHRLGIKVIEGNLVEGTKSEAVRTLEQLFKKLEDGRNDVVIETRLSGLATINKLGLKDIVMLEPPLMSLPLFHCLHVKNKDLVEPLTAVLQQMEEEGVIEEIQKKAEQSVQSPAK